MGTGERIKEERERLGLSQAEFAALAGAHRKSQGNYESGERSPDANYLAALAAAGVDVLYVVTGVRGGVVLKPDERMLLERYRASQPPLRDAALRVLLGGEASSGGVRKIKIAGGSGHQIAGGNIRNQGKGKA